MSQQPNQVRCDACQATFPMIAQAERVDDGEIQFFVCPECGQRYDYALVTPAGLRIRADMHSIDASLKKSSDPRLKSRYEKLKAAYRAEVLPATAVPQ